MIHLSSKTLANVLLLVCGSSMVIFTLRTIITDNDFNVYFHAGLRWNQGENIYSEAHYRGLPYYYGPLFAMLMGLSNSWPLVVVKTGWYLLNLFFIGRCIVLLQKLTPAHFTKYSPFVALIVGFLCFRQIQLNLLTGQVSFLILWCMIEGFYRIKKGDIWIAAVILAFGIHVKVIPIIMVPWLLYSRHFKAVFSTVFASIIFLIIPYFFVGFTYGNLLLVSWLHAINPFAAQHSVSHVSGYLDIGALIYRYLASPLHESGSVPWEIPTTSVRNLTSLVRAFFLFLSIRTLYSRWKGSMPLPTPDRDMFFIAGLWGTVPLLFPHQRDYSFLYMLPCLIITVVTYLGSAKTPALRYVILAIGILLWAPYINGEFYSLFWDQWNDDKWITLGGMVLMGLYFSFGKPLAEKRKVALTPALE
jgi:hypothetical protein